jgi:hypothetical protein
MAILFPNRTGQLGVYKTGTPNYVDVSGTESIPGLQLANTQATAQSWADGDTMGIVVAKNADNWQVWHATWVAASSYFQATTVEDSAGTLADDDVVNVFAAPTRETLLMALITPQIASVVYETTTARTLTIADAGKVIRCSNASAVTITPEEGLALNTQFVIAQASTGLVSVARAGSDTINGGTASVSLGGQFTTGYLLKTSSSGWDFYG